MKLLKKILKWLGVQDKSGLWHMNQGSENSCTMYAIAHAAQMLGVKNITPKIVNRLFKEATKIDDKPDDWGTTIPAGMSIAIQNGWFTGWNWVENLDDIPFPAVMATPWLSNMEDIWSNGQMQYGGKMLGHHVVMIKGITSDGKYIIHNSRGTSWGDGGDGYISRSDLFKLIMVGAKIAAPNQN